MTLVWLKPCCFRFVRNENRLQILIFLSVFSATCIQSGASVFYIDQSNPNASDGNSGTANLPWKTIAKANSTLATGDSVFIKAGTYNQGIAPNASGTSGSPITYQNFGSDYVLITGNVVGITLDQKCWITVSGINFSNITAFGSLTSATNNTLTNCLFTTQLGSSYWSGLGMVVSSQSNLVTNCTLSKWGSTSPTSGDMVDIGNDTDPTDLSFYNRIENCTLSAAGHALLELRCGRQIVRGNWFHNEPWSNGYGHRCIISDTSVSTVLGGYNLIESNRISFAAHSVDGGANNGMDMRTRFNIVRYNSFYNCTDSGLAMEGGGGAGDLAIFNHIYNNTFYTNALDLNFSGAAIGMQTYAAPFVVMTNSFFNNLMYQQPSAFWNSGANAALSLQIVSNNWQNAGNPKFSDITTPYTATTPGKPDFSLQSNSPCIDAGAFLTRVTSSSGSGNSITVADPYFFQSGMGGIQGDWIQLQGQSNTAQITAINGSNLVLNRSLTWTKGQGVSLPYKGTAPDVGAFEYTPPDLTRPDPPSNLHVVSSF